jgi:hypothetical protein
MAVEKIYFLGRLKFLLVCFGKEAAGVDQGDELGYVYEVLGEGAVLFEHKAVVRAVRDKAGMYQLLNSTIDCQHHLFAQELTLYQRFEEEMLGRAVLSKEGLRRLQALDQRLKEGSSKRARKRDKLREKEGQGLKRQSDGMC